MDHHAASSSTQRRAELLYAGFDSYAQFLTESARIAKLYATLWQNVTVVTLQGTAFALHGGCQPPGIHTTLNKIRLLFYAIDRAEEGEFDQVLLLDADTLLSNMQVDVTTLLPKERQLLATHTTHTDDASFNKTVFRPINAGVTLWNLHHPQIQSVALDWFEGAKDQKYLNAALEKLEQEQQEQHHHPSKAVVVRYLESGEFAKYSHGTVVQHFLQHSSENL
jgi:hypothetical protein